MNKHKNLEEIINEWNVSLDKINKEEYTKNEYIIDYADVLERVDVMVTPKKVPWFNGG